MMEETEVLEHAPAPPVPDKYDLTTPDERRVLGEIVVWDTLRLTPNPLNPRGAISPDDPSIAELAQSIKEHGLIQPIVTTPAGTIVAGHRRYYACLAAGVQMVRVVVRELSEREQLEIMLVENVQRSDLNPVQIARGYKALHDRGMSIADIAAKVKWGKASVSKHLDILSLPPEVQDMYARGELALGYIPHLLELKDPASQIEVATDAAQNHYLINEVACAVNRRKPKRGGQAQSPAEEGTHTWKTVCLSTDAVTYLEDWARREKLTIEKLLAKLINDEICMDVDWRWSDKHLTQAQAHDIVRRIQPEFYGLK